MRRAFSEEEIKDNYPGYKEANLIFGNCFLYIIGPAQGPFKIGRSTRLLSRFQSLYCNNHMEIRLHYAMPTPIGIGHKLEKAAHKILSRSHLKNEWFDTPLPVAMAALKTVNPLAPEYDFGGMTYAKMLKTPDKYWGTIGLIPLERKLVQRMRAEDIRRL